MAPCRIQITSSHTTRGLFLICLCGLRRPVFNPLHKPLCGSAFSLKVQVVGARSHRRISTARVDVYVNYSRTYTVLTGDDGGVLLNITYRTVAPVTVVVSKDGYLPTALPYKANRLPIFSSVTVSLLALNQGNIWLYEDSVLIRGRSSDTSSWPVVQFPKSLLNLTDSGDITEVKAYLSVPQLREDSFQNAPGIMESTSGYVSVDLRPTAAVSVQLYSGDTELPVSGPVQISLRVPDFPGLQASSVIPAWFFNQTTGGWMRKGLGTVKTIEGELLWTFSAPHLGYWIAAPLSSTTGLAELNIPIDLILHHASLLLFILGGILFIAVCHLRGRLCSSRRSLAEANTKRILPVIKKDQSTSTCCDEVLEILSGDSTHAQNGAVQPFTESASVISTRNGSTNPSAVAIAMEGDSLELSSDTSDLTCVLKTTEQIRVTASLTDSLFFYNQPVAILHTPALLHLEEQPERSKSATLPRAGASNIGTTEPLGKDSFTQTTPNGITQNQAAEAELSEASQGASRAHFSLPESVSAPGTLNNIVVNRHSMHAMTALAENPSLQPPRAWFVSLEGKPAAEIRYAVSEEQRRRRPAESRETSLDSGVDMSELNQTSGRRVTLERNVTFVKSSKNVPPQ
uniref:Protein FAM171B-like n=1 Tax=Takifugu rubripes TaxID=31033 RepID=A0A674P340_TAKRU